MKDPFIHKFLFCFLTMLTYKFYKPYSLSVVFILIIFTMCMCKCYSKYPNKSITMDEK